jgi:transposase-like protein
MLDYTTFTAMYARYESSGLKVRDFCHKEGLHETTFYYWSRRLKECQKSSDKFVPLLVEKYPTATATATDINTTTLAPSIASSNTLKELLLEISMPNGVHFKLKGEISPDYFCAIIKFIR